MNFNPHMVTLRQLQYIVAVAECLSFNRAAQECHVSQPSLSAQIAEVERLLGVKLFERDRRRVLLTAAGRDFVTQARAVLRESDALAEAARRFIDPLSGTLRFGVIPTISPYFLSRLTPMLHSAFPGLRVLWLEEKTRPLMSRLDAGEIDAALVAFEADLGEVNREVIGKDPFVLVAPRGNPLAAGDGPVKLSELRNEDIFILTDDHCFGKQALALCMNAKARDHEFKATSLATIVSMVAGGVGVTLLPKLSVPHEVRIRNLRVRRFAEPAPARTICLVWRKNSSLAPALRKVAAVMREGYPE